MPYKSRRQQGFFHAMAQRSRGAAGAKWNALAKRWDRETYKARGGSTANRRRFAGLPTRVKRRR